MNFRIKIILSILLATLHLSGQTDITLKYIPVGPEDILAFIRFKEDPVLTDVHLSFEYRKGHLENSINIPIKLNPKKILRKVEQFPKDTGFFGFTARVM